MPPLRSANSDDESAPIYSGPVFEMARQQFHAVADHLGIPDNERDRGQAAQRLVPLSCFLSMPINPLVRAMSPRPGASRTWERIFRDVPYDAIGGVSIFAGWLFTIIEIRTRGTRPIIAFLIATMIIFVVGAVVTAIAIRLFTQRWHDLKR